MQLYRRYAVAIFWAAIALVYVVAIMPAGKAPDLGAGDKVNHIAAFMVLTLLGRIAYRRRHGWRLGIGLSGYGALIELTQAIPILNRDAAFADWLADSAAVAFMLIVTCRFR